MSRADYYAAQRSKSEHEILMNGRTEVHNHIATVAGRGSTVEFRDEMSNVETGARLDRFVVCADGGQGFSAEQRAALEHVSTKCSFWGDDAAHVFVDQATYDKRILPFDYTADQRQTFCFALVTVVLLVVAAVAIDHYRREHLPHMHPIDINDL